MIKENESQPLLSGKQYWKSLDELAETSEFRTWVGKEFPEGAELLDNVQRRGFLKTMAASFGLAGLGMAGCRRPEHTILPYGKSPEELIPGIPSFYATSRPSPFGFSPLIAESHQGRPTKIEGNPSYIKAGGSTDIYSQASILDIYDPDRAKGSYTREKLTQGSKSATRWKKANSAELISAISDWSNTGGVAIISDYSDSIIRKELLNQLSSKGVKHLEYEPVNPYQAESSLSRSLGYSQYLRTLPNLGKAKKVLSLDCDFLGNREPNSIVNSRQFMSGRKVLSASDASAMNRLYSVESDLTLTGGVADHRLRLSSSRIEAFAALFYAEILTLQKSKDGKLIDHLLKISKDVEVDRSWVSECAKDLLKKPKQSVVLAGLHQSQGVHLLSLAINQALGCIGSCISYLPTEPKSSYSFEDLTSDIEQGRVKSLIILGGNPVYNCPNSGLVDLLSKVENSVHLGHNLDETSQHCDHHIGQSHFLESWDLGYTWDRSCIVPVQPLIAPLFDTRSDLELLSALCGSKHDAHALVLDAYNKLSSSNVSFDDFLRIGVHKIKQSFRTNFTDINLKVKSLNPVFADIGSSSLEILLTPDFHTWDGRFSNNGWMLECPDPISKLTWDNALLVSPVFAKHLEAKHPGIGLLPKPTMLNKNGQIAPDAAVFDDGKQKAPVITLHIDDHHSLTGPVYVQPGLADFTIVASLGFGRNHAGRVGNDLGYNALSLLHTDGNRVITNATYSPSGEFKTLANVQEHWSMEGRAIVREANADEYKSDTSFAHHMGAESHSPPIYGKDLDKDLAFKAQTTPRGNSSYEHPDHNYEKSEEHGLHQWGMSIDLNQCTGCSACVVACQSENNIPVVGKDQVLRGREMHWIRLDRYFSSKERDGAELPSDVQVSFQGVACMHCETAPCETVCPVNATVHDEEGLNAMAYNRCVGTRYCANNCPYKVRRFNFFDWNKRKTDDLYKGPLGEKNDDISAMGKNPDVTVRMRGVMEKCTYCTQRIQESKIRSKVKAQRMKTLESGKDGKELVMHRNELKVADGGVQTACQQVCPTDAIVFGDISDPQSEVSKLKSNPRDYSVLGYLSTRPRTTFLAKVRNPNPRMPDHSTSPHAAREYHDKAHPAHHGEDHSSKH